MFFKTGLEQRTVLSLLSTPSATVPRIPAGGAWLPASGATVAQCSHSRGSAHTGLGVLCGWSQLWQSRGKLEASRVREVTYSLPPFLEDRAQTHTPGGRAYCLLPQGCFTLCRWFPSWSQWAASVSVRSADRKGHICAAEAGSGVLVWRQALSICL